MVSPHFMPSIPALAASGLSKRYGDVLAVGGVSFEVAPGEIVGLLGPNGAGKTTIISMVLGVLEPSAGRILIQGKDIAARRSEALERTNFAAVYAPLPGNLTVRENLRVFGLLYGAPRLKRRIEDLLDGFDLRKFADSKAGFLSSGEQTRLGLAKALINEPSLLLLDEPTASLDPATAREIRSKIREFVRRGGAGVLWTSHNMHEVAEVCDRALFLSRGQILLEGDPRRLPSQHGKANLEELFIAVAREPLSLEAA